MLLHCRSDVHVACRLSTRTKGTERVNSELAALRLRLPCRLSTRTKGTERSSSLRAVRHRERLADYRPEQRVLKDAPCASAAYAMPACRLSTRTKGTERTSGQIPAPGLPPSLADYRPEQRVLKA